MGKKSWRGTHHANSFRVTQRSLKDHFLCESMLWTEIWRQKRSDRKLRKLNILFCNGCRKLNYTCCSYTSPQRKKKSKTRWKNHGTFRKEKEAISVYNNKGIINISGKYRLDPVCLPAGTFQRNEFAAFSVFFFSEISLFPSNVSVISLESPTAISYSFSPPQIPRASS